MVVIVSGRGLSFVMLELFYRLPKNVIRIFSGRNLGGHALAIALTMIIVGSGLDWSYYLATRDLIFIRLAFPAVVLGGVVPLWGILAILLFGAIRKNQRVITTAWAVGASVASTRHQSWLPTGLAQRRRFLGLAVVPHHRGVRHGGLPDHTTSQEQNVRRPRRVGDHPLVLRIRRRRDLRRFDRDRRWQKFRQPAH